MANWFECKVKYVKVDVTGKEKKVSEPYLVDAVSFTDAEKRIHEKMQQYVTGEFSVTNIKIANYSELHPNDTADRWFKCKVSFMTIDEEKGIEKKTNTYILVQANNVQEAYAHLDKGLSDIVSDYQIPAITESPIVDVFPYFSHEEQPIVPQNFKPVAQVVDMEENTDFENETYNSDDDEE